jgi:hypothetical protein
MAVKTKSLLAGALGLYGILSIASSFGISLLLGLPIVAFGINVGQVILGLICLAVAYYLLR